MNRIHGTTILCVRKNNEVCMAGDGQVTLDKVVLKPNARKIRRIYKDSVVAGFAGSTADALTLFERLEKKIEEFQGRLKRACVELAKDWRSDKLLRRLEAMIILASSTDQYLVSGSGDVIENESGALAIGSGGNYALAAARALMDHSSLTATQIALTSLEIASDLCIYTNKNITHETILSEQGT